ncbi:unnamed protein product [Rotaria sp. Silwood2]|nr:unnamed protein product [Rotaria sp. Silwood2]
MTTFIGSDVHFLHAFIENQKGRLYTSVYHDSISQPFLLPYTHSHPRLFHPQWFRAALIRAGQYCSSFEDFEEERLYLELTFLANGYSLDFVEYQLRQFFLRFNSKSHEPMNLNRFTYLSIRHELFRCIDQQRHNPEEEQELHKNYQLIQLHYLFDWGSRCQFNQKFYKLCSEILEQDLHFKEIRSRRTNTDRSHKYADTKDENCPYNAILRKFLTILSNSSKTLQTINSLNQQMLLARGYHLFSSNQVSQAAFIDNQKQLETW